MRGQLVNAYAFLPHALPLSASSSSDFVFDAGSETYATRWSEVWQAGHADTAVMRRALQSLCQEYWPPVYAFIRRQGKSEHDAEDRTQAFFHHLLDSKWFAKADPSRGRLRGFLFRSLQNFLNQTQRTHNAKKRGGLTWKIQMEHAEHVYTEEVSDGLSPDVLFQKRWVLTTIERALAEMEKKYTTRRQGALFAALLPRLQDLERAECEDDDEVSAAALGLKAVSFRVALNRACETFRTYLFREVTRTIATEDPTEIRAELESLLEYL